jgi:hypothetical protein
MECRQDARQKVRLTKRVDRIQANVMYPSRNNAPDMIEDHAWDEKTAV